jgi:16S rRNA (uracil1498-N3)-methyltransferase
MRDPPRLFVPAVLAEGAAAGLSPGQAHYLRHVLRLGAGDPVRLFNGRDGEWAAVLGASARDGAEAVAVRPLRAQAPEPDLWLAFAPLKRDATDWLVEKATELGASALLPVFTERAVAGRVNLERLRAIAVEAAEQCERLSVPELRPPVRLGALLDAWPRQRRLAVAIERSGAPLPAAPAGGLLSGPEGGFTGAELDAMRARPFVVAVSLGPRILRAETAVIAGLALLQARAGCRGGRDPGCETRESDVQPR